MRVSVHVETPGTDADDNRKKDERVSEVRIGDDAVTLEVPPHKHTTQPDV